MELLGCECIVRLNLRSSLETQQKQGRKDKEKTVSKNVDYHCSQKYDKTIYSKTDSEATNFIFLLQKHSALSYLDGPIRANLARIA